MIGLLFLEIIMKIQISSTANLGDFLSALPILSGISIQEKKKIHLIIRKEMRKFKRLKELRMFQDIFEEVSFEDEIFLYNQPIMLSSWARYDRNDPNRPIETCRYENWLKDHYGYMVQSDDNFTIKYNKLNSPVEQDKYYVGDRWSVGDIDVRRKTEVLSHLEGNFVFIDYNNDLLTNCYYISESPKPFITNMTGVSVLADLLNKEQYIVWKAEDWNPEFRKGDNISWDNGFDIDTIFQKHYYGNRKSKLIHANELDKIL